MNEGDRCGLHEAVVFGAPESTEALLELSRSPIGDECQVCPVCRGAREYIAVKLAEQRGQVLPPDETSAVALKKLQAAIEATKASVRRRG